MIKKYKKLLILLGFMITFLGAQILYRKGYIDLQNLKVHKQYLKSIASGHPVLAAVLLLFAYTLAVALMFPLGALFSVGAGFLFGTMGGMGITILGASIGTMVGVFACRFLLNGHFHTKTTFHGLKVAHYRSLIPYLILIRSFFIIPSSVVNGVLSLSNIPLSVIGWTTAVGMIPVSYIFCSAGSGLDQLQSLSDIMTWKVAIILGLLFIGILGSILVQRKVNLLQLFRLK